MNQKGFVNIILIVAIVVLLVVVGYFAFVKKSKPIEQQSIPIPTNEQQPTPILTKIKNLISPVSPAKTVGWKTYTDSLYGFEFKYPTEWNATWDNEHHIISITSSRQAEIVFLIPPYEVNTANIKAYVNDYEQGLPIKSTSNNIIKQFDKYITVNNTSSYQTYLEVENAGQVACLLPPCPQPSGESLRMTTYIPDVQTANGNHILHFTLGMYDDNKIDKNMKNKYVETYNQILSTFKFIN